MNQFLVTVLTFVSLSSFHTYLIKGMDFRHECSLTDIPGHAIFADMHDGDKKKAKIAGRQLTIQPYDNNESWVVNAGIDIVHCNATVNFNVPGKPNPPPVNLTLTIWEMVHSGPPNRKTAFEFTDPSGALGSSKTPLNIWVMIERLDE